MLWTFLLLHTFGHLNSKKLHARFDDISDSLYKQ